MENSIKHNWEMKTFEYDKFMELQYKRLDEKEKFINLEKSELTEIDTDEISSLIKRSIRKHHDVKSQMGEDYD
ncbi:MAG: hypothetical protein GQ533_08050 [Methanosarcinaceae archaeon]|nr:hypothetical protein [Methanosarcinaceae archaeon]